MLSATDLICRANPSVCAHPASDGRGTEGPADKQHEDAKRFARLLVSEIKLYNETKVQEGRKE